MAYIGMRHVVAAKITSHTDGSAPTYGTGMVIGKAILGNLTINRGTNPLYADDAIAEDDNGITSADLELGMDDLLEDAQEYLGITKKVTTGEGTSAVTKYLDTGNAANDVGVGYIRVRVKNGETKFQTVWNYSAKFGITAENSATKGEAIEWQTPTVTGRLKGLLVDSSGDITYREKRIFDGYSDAVAYLNSLANIT